LLAAPSAAYAAIQTWRDPETFYRHAPVQPAALLTFVIYAASVSFGYTVAN